MNSTFEWGMEKKASAHTYTHTRTYILGGLGETATPRVCSKSDNVALERRFVNTLEKMRGGGWYSLSLFLSRTSIYLLRIAWLLCRVEKLGVLSFTAKRLSRPRSGPGCFERLLIAATRLSWCVVTILGVMGRFRFLEKLVKVNGMVFVTYCYVWGSWKRRRFLRISFSGNEMLIIEKRCNNLVGVGLLSFREF